MFSRHPYVVGIAAARSFQSDSSGILWLGYRLWLDLWHTPQSQLPVFYNRIGIYFHLIAVYKKLKENVQDVTRIRIIQWCIIAKLFHKFYHI